MPFGLLLLLPFFAHAMDDTGFRKSANVEDRSYEDSYPTAPLDLLKKLQPLAEKPAMPFFCPALKPVAPRFADLARRLADVETPRALKDTFDGEVKNMPVTLSVSGAGEACEGAKEQILTEDSNAEAKIMWHHTHLMNLHQGLAGEAHVIAQAIDQRLAQPTLGDKVNNLMADCSGYTVKVREALAQYLKEVSGLSSYYLSLIQSIHTHEDKIGAIKCGTADGTTPKASKSRRK